MYDYAMTQQPLLCGNRCDFAAAFVLLLQTYHRRDFAATEQNCTENSAVLRKIAQKTVQFYEILHKNQCNFIEFCTKISATLRWRRRS